MISLNEAIRVVNSKFAKKLTSVLQTNSKCYFAYDGDEHRGYCAVSKAPGHLSVFVPHFNLEKYVSMTLVKKYN